MSIYQIAVNGLQAAQAGLAVTAHNISNVDTPGYSRQALLQSANPAVFSGSGYFGTGVSVDSVVRRYDQFLTNEVTRTTSAASQYEATYAQAASVDQLLGDSTMGIAAPLSDFFAALNTLAAAPGDASSRQAMLSSAETLAGRFRMMDDALNSRRVGLEQRLDDAVASANAITRQIGTLNERIVVAQGRGDPPNDLYDQRDALVQQLAGLGAISTARQDDGSMNVYLGNGSPLVVGASVFQLKSQPDRFDAMRRSVGLDTGTGITEFASGDQVGGEIGGLMNARADVIDRAQDQLGRIAMVLAEAINTQHRLGQDRNGNPGGDFFGVAPPWISPSSTNAGNAVLTATLASPGALTAADYAVNYTAAGWVVTNLGDNTSTTYATLPQTVGGVTLAVGSGAPQVGDQYLLRPTKEGAAFLRVAITDINAIAAAAPIRTAAGANMGSGSITSGTVTSLDPNLLQPVTITFNANGTFNVAGTGTGNPTNVAYTPGMTIAYNGWSAVLDGAPAGGDSFTVGPNTSGVGDNRNALAMAALQTSRSVGNGAYSLGDAYGALMADVGITTRGAQIGRQAQATMLNEATQAQQAVSGVNLDEEAANLIKYQQAYQAASKVIQVADSLFQSLLAIGR